MATVYAPHLTSPKGAEIFNLGKVTITWDRNDPPTDDSSVSTSNIFYEIQYTENYDTPEANWHTIKKRIAWSEESFEWIVGKMIKSDSIRLRIRARNLEDGIESDWSMSSGDFSINVFKLIPPAIISPLPDRVYTDFILIVLDETLTKNTFNQKVRYTLEYSSNKMDVDWTTIVKDVPVGQNVIRWDLDNLLPSDDYVLRLTVKNASTSCIETAESIPDQIAKRFVYNLKIQQPGLFYIDTKPPDALIDIEGDADITSRLTHFLNIYAEDDTTEVEQIQIRECEAAARLPLGDRQELLESSSEICPSVETLLADPNFDVNHLIGKPKGYSARTQWTLEDQSGLRRLDAILTDSGGNSSIQRAHKSFIPLFKGAASITDFIVVNEQRDDVDFDIDEDTGTCNVTTVKDGATFEVVYLVNSVGEYWVLEPFPKLITTLSVSNLQLVFQYGSNIYIFGATEDDFGRAFRDDKGAVNLLESFTSALSIPTAAAEFDDVLYIGMANGELWSYDAISFTLVNTFANRVNTLAGDDQFLYIGLANSSLVTLYNGTDFITSDVDP